jgi:hypothetical protein
MPFMEQVKSRRWLRLPKSNLIPRAREDRAILMQCIGIALVFWVGVRMSQTYVSTKKIELHFLLPPNQAFRQAPPRNMSIQLKGRGWDMLYDYLLGARIHLTYDLTQRSSIRLDEKRLLNDISEHVNADDLSFSNLTHTDIRISLEPKMQKWVPIRPISDLSYLPGYYLSGNVKVAPDSILITGPASKIGPTYEWPTATLTLKDLKDDYKGFVELKTPPAEINLNLQRVDVQVPVEQVTEKTLFVKIQVKNADREYRLFPSQVRLTCNVGLSHFNSLRSEDFKAEVDLSNVELQEGNTVPVMVNLQPTIVSNVRFLPKVVEFYTVKKEIN